MDLSRYKLSHHLLHEALSGQEKLERYELSLLQGSSGKAEELQALVRLGNKACGHPFFLHGGVIASVFDDAMGMLFLSSGNGIGYTAKLTVDYRRPIPAGTELRVLCKLDRVEVSAKSGARKVFLSARMESAQGSTLFAEASALFVVKTVPGGALLEGGRQRVEEVVRDVMSKVQQLREGK